MIIECPTCSSKFSVNDDAVNEGTMVRCSICLTTWHAEPPVNDENDSKVDAKSEKQKKNKVFWRDTRESMHWVAFFIVTAFSGCFLFLSTSYIARIPDYIRYVKGQISHNRLQDQLKLFNVSHYFTKKDDGLYVTVTGSIKNISKKIVQTPYLSINLRTSGEEFANYENPEMFLNETWAEKIDVSKLEPNKSIVFETAPKKVAMHDLMCTIKLGKNI